MPIPVIARPTPDTIGLYLHHQLQGSYFSEPQIPGLGPYVFANTYMCGWLAAGSTCPQGDFVMVGLGSGAGAVGLLCNFPQLTLTVLEINPAVVESAQEAFPMLGHFQNEGRLQIQVGDAQEYLTGQDRWDVGLADAYLGENNHVDHYLESLQACTEEQWYNCIGSPDRGPLAALLAAMPIRSAYSLDPYSGRLANWILSSYGQPVDGFVPYRDDSSEAANWVRRHYRQLLGENHLADLRRPAQ